jgi:hypothetical protein
LQTPKAFRGLLLEEKYAWLVGSKAATGKTPGSEKVMLLADRYFDNSARLMTNLYRKWQLRQALLGAPHGSEGADDGGRGK